MKQAQQNFTRNILFTAIAGLYVGSVAAQGVLTDEIVVTAQKRETTLSDTPIAITAVGAEQMKDFGLYSAQDISNFTPSMSFQETAGGGEGNRIYLRGIGRETSSAGTEPGVGVYNNGFYSNESAALAVPVDLVERVEVLRGPQGTLFGRNTTGGAISTVIKKPGEEMEHVIRARAGNYDAVNVELTSSGPLTDKIGYLAHYSSLDRNSFTENVSGPDPIGVDAEYMELQLDVDLADNVNWHFRTFSGKFDNETLGMAKLDGYRSGATGPIRLNPTSLVMNPELFAPLADAPDSSDPFKRSSDYQGSVSVDDQETYHSTLTVDFDQFSVRMLNGYQSSSWVSSKDYDGTASPVSYIEDIGQEETNEQHELQFISSGDGAVNWVAGLFYLKNENNQPYTLSDPNNPYLTGLAGNDAGYFYEQRAIVETVSTAVYGQLDWAVSDQLVLSAGLRYSEDEKDASETQRINYEVISLGGACVLTVPILLSTENPYFTFSPLCRYAFQLSDKSATHEESWDAVNWRLNASYNFDNGDMAYATVSTGYKPGGFRLGAMQDVVGTPEDESVVDNEELVAYEFGYKGKLSESFSLSAALYYYDYQDIQVELDIFDTDSGITTARLANASATDVYGLELESVWAATSNLTLLMNYSYLDSEYKDDFSVLDLKTNVVKNVKGNELNRTPNNKFTLGANYVHALNGGAVVASGSYSWIDEQYVSVFNDSEESIDSYNVLNGRVAWQPDSGSYTVALWGQNLTDELSYANSFSVSTLADGARRNGTPIAPRTFGVEVALFF